MREKMILTWVYPKPVQILLDHYAVCCDEIFERAKKEISEQHLTPRETQRIQNRVQEEITPYIDEMVRLRSTAIPIIEMKLGE